MAMSKKLVNAQKSEWALCRRHQSEKIFGIQVCGAKVGPLFNACELIREYCTVNFVDLNVGCPIGPLVTDHGAGSGLLRTPNILENILRGMTHVLDCPVTAKLRMGFSNTKFVAHTIIDKLARAGISAVSLHGRTRQQRCIFAKFSLLYPWVHDNYFSLS